MSTGTDFDVLAQRIATQRGARTGEVHIDDALEEGASGILAGHSEARANFAGESDETINRQVREAYIRKVNTVILCVGETAEEKSEGRTDAVVTSQVLGGLEGLTPEQVGKIIIAYEPRWAIKGSGYGKAAEPPDAQQAAALIRKVIQERFSAEAAHGVRILYGGAVDQGNAASFLVQDDIDGLLVGGRSTAVAEFLPIVEAARQTEPAQGRIPYIGGNWKTYEIKDDYRAFAAALNDLDPARVAVGIAPSLTKIRSLAEALRSSTPPSP